MPNYIQPIDLIDLTDDEMQARLNDEQSKMDSFDGAPGQKAAEFWTHVANFNTIFQVIERRRKRREQ